MTIDSRSSPAARAPVSAASITQRAIGLPLTSISPLSRPMRLLEPPAITAMLMASIASEVTDRVDDHIGDFCDLVVSELDVEP